MTMGVTYEQARESVRARLEPGWKWGTFCLDDRRIVENDKLWVFAVGAREHLVGGNKDYAIAGGVTVVYKSDGHIGALATTEVATDFTIQGRPNPRPTLSADPPA